MDVFPTNQIHHPITVMLTADEAVKLYTDIRTVLEDHCDVMSPMSRDKIKIPAVYELFDKLYMMGCAP